MTIITQFLIILLFQQFSYQQLYQIIFRLDDVQDYWITNSQKAIIFQFNPIVTKSNSTKISIACLGSVLGNDTELTNFIKQAYNDDYVDIISNGWDATELDKLNLSQQITLLNNTNKKLVEVFDLKQIVALSPYRNFFNQDTIQAILQLGMSVISTQQPRQLCDQQSQIRFIPANVSTQWATNVGRGIVAIDEILQNIDLQVNTCGFAVVLMRPQDFVDQDLRLNYTAIEELQKLIQRILGNQSYQFTTLSSYQNPQIKFVLPIEPPIIEIIDKKRGFGFAISILSYFIVFIYCLMAWCTLGQNFEMDEDFYSKTINPFYSITHEDTASKFLGKFLLLSTSFLWYELISYLFIKEGLSLIMTAIYTGLLMILIKIINGFIKILFFQKRKCCKYQINYYLIFFILISAGIIFLISYVDYQTKFKKQQFDWLYSILIYFTFDYIILDAILYLMKKQLMLKYNGTIWEVLLIFGFNKNYIKNQKINGQQENGLSNNKVI